MVRVPLSKVATRAAADGRGDNIAVEKLVRLPLRPKDADEAAVSIHPLASRHGVILKVSPPKAPSDPGLSHVPCDIVLAIDVSGSMARDAPAPASRGDVREKTGLSVLDLIKHAARTILETLNEGDRLGIVTFASQAKVIQQLLPMTESNKELAKDNIHSMRPLDATNLWHGIRKSIKLFNDEINTGRVPAIMVLTDGLPNIMCPGQGYVPKIRSLGQLPATIHTFGFGYFLSSGLLKSIAEVGGGNYAFIPDAGMIGTVFVHAVANVQSTFANNAVLKIVYPSSLQLAQTMGNGVDVQQPIELGAAEGDKTQLTISLSNIQYGQTRDIYLRYANEPSFSPGSASAIDAILEYTKLTQPVRKSVARRSIADFTDMPEAEIAYHKSRSAICAFLSTIFPLCVDGEHRSEPHSADLEHRLKQLIKTLPAAAHGDPLNASLMADLAGPEPQGQVSVAIQNASFFRKWGVHYLPSLQGAHARQLCNSFKDPGPLQYGAQSPLFIQCRDTLDATFDTLPAPQPSNAAEPGVMNPMAHSPHTLATTSYYSMSGYNWSGNPCFAGFCRVDLADGASAAVSRLRKGMEVQTPRGPRKVAALLKTRVRREVMVKVGGLLVTPWHPVKSGAEKWVFPADVASERVRYTGSIYSILLQQDAAADAHAVMIEGFWGVTLGHGVTTGSDCRAHRFLGDYRMVSRSLARLRPRTDGLVVGDGIKRDRKTGRVCGFKSPQHRAHGRRTSSLVLRKALTSWLRR